MKRENKYKAVPRQPVGIAGRSIEMALQPQFRSALRDWVVSYKEIWGHLIFEVRELNSRFPGNPLTYLDKLRLIQRKENRKGQLSKRRGEILDEVLLRVFAARGEERRRFKIGALMSVEELAAVSNALYHLTGRLLEAPGIPVWFSLATGWHTQPVTSGMYHIKDLVRGWAYFWQKLTFYESKPEALNLDGSDWATYNTWLDGFVKYKSMCSSPSQLALPLVESRACPEPPEPVVPEDANGSARDNNIQRNPDGMRPVDPRPVPMRCEIRDAQQTVVLPAATMNDVIGLHESPENYAPELHISATINYLQCSEAQLLEMVDMLKDKLKGTRICVTPEGSSAIQLLYPVHSAWPLKEHVDMKGIVRFINILDTVHSMVWLLIKFNKVSEELTK